MHFLADLRETSMPYWRNLVSSFFQQRETKWKETKRTEPNRTELNRIESKQAETERFWAGAIMRVMFLFVT